MQTFYHISRRYGGDYPRKRQQFQVDDYFALAISCAARRAAVREVVRREGAERPFAASAARLAARDASHSSHVILMTSFSDESATLHLLAQRALKQIGSRLNIGYSSFNIKFHIEHCIKNHPSFARAILRISLHRPSAIADGITVILVHIGFQ